MDGHAQDAEEIVVDKQIGDSSNDPHTRLREGAKNILRGVADLRNAINKMRPQYEFYIEI